MKITIGSTRIVVLTAGAAWKIARIRPLRCLGHLISMTVSSRSRRYFFEKYGERGAPSLIKAIARDLFAGIYANHSEFCYWHRSRDRRVMATERTFFGSFVIAQIKGEPVSAHDMAQKSPAHFIPFLAVRETCEAKQFCRAPNGHIVLIDYGDRSTIELLRTS